MPRKARDPKDVKAKILNAALTLFTKEGCKNITMNDIANSIRISKRTLYETYNDREQLLEDCCQYIKEEAMRSVEEITKNTDDAILRFSANMRILLLYGVRYHKFLQDLQERYPGLHDKYYNYKNILSRDKLSSILQKGIEEGHILPIVPVEEFTRTLFMLGDMAYKAYPRSPKTQKIFVDFYSFILIRGIMSDSAISHYSEIMHRNSLNSKDSEIYNSIIKDLVPNGTSLKNYIINLLADSNRQIIDNGEILANAGKKRTRQKKNDTTKGDSRKTKPTIKDKYDAKMKAKAETKAKKADKKPATTEKPKRSGRPRKSEVQAD